MATPDLPGDQREEDGGALTFQSAPLTQPLEILGVARLDLEVAADKPVAMVAARISDVAPDGKATRVTFGLLNLTHRNSDAFPEGLEPGKAYRVRVYLNGIGHRFPAGNQLRVSLSSSYWPLTWTPPQVTMLKLNLAASALTLPVRQAPETLSTPSFAPPPEQAPDLPVIWLEDERRVFTRNWSLTIPRNLV